MDAIEQAVEQAELENVVHFASGRHFCLPVPQSTGLGSLALSFCVDFGRREKTPHHRVTSLFEEPVAIPVGVDHLQRRSTGNGSVARIVAASCNDPSSILLERERFFLNRQNFS